jgi:hypothetical protein
MSEQKRYGIYLDEVVKMAVNDLGEDYTKSKVRFLSWALRGLKENSRQTLNLGLRREIIPIHAKTNTASIPCDAKEVTFVGILNDCDEKVSLTLSGKIVGSNVEEKKCIDKCNICNEDIDVCEKLEVTVTERIVTINGVDYIETTTKRLLGNEYFEIINTPYYDVELDDVVFRESKKFVAKITRNDCGCVKSTPENIETIKEHCNDCYISCFAPCIHSKSDIAYYTVSMRDGLIHFNSGIPYDKIYIEYIAGLPKENGKILVPEVAAETINYYVKWKYLEHNVKISRAERLDAFNFYKIAKMNMIKNLSKISLEQLIRIVHKTPRFALNVPGDSIAGRNERNYSRFITERGNTILGNEISKPDSDIAEDGWNI